MRISLRAFTVNMENLQRFEFSLQSIWEKWNLHRNEFRSARSHVIISHRSETLSQSEISNWFEFTSGIM